MPEKKNGATPLAPPTMGSPQLPGPVALPAAEVKTDVAMPPDKEKGKRKKGKDRSDSRESSGSQSSNTRQIFMEAEQFLLVARQQAEQTRLQYQEAEQLLQGSKSRAGELKQHAEQAEEEYRRAHQQLAAIKKQTEEVGTYLQTARQQSETSREQLRETEQELRVARDYVETTKKQSQAARLEFQEAETTMEAARRQLTAVRELVPEMEQEIQLSRGQFQQVRAGCQEVEEDLLRARDEAIGLGSRFLEVRVALEESQRELEAILQEVAERRQRRQELEVLAATLEQAQSDLEEEASEDLLSGDPTLEDPAGLPVQENLEPAASPEPAAPLVDEQGEVVYARLRLERKEERLLRYLNEAWAVEKQLVSTLETMAKEVIDLRLRALFEEHRQVTERQRDALEARIRALGKKPSGGKGFFQRMIGGIWDSLRGQPDDFDKTTQDVMKGFATENFETAMYRALEAYAGEIGDLETAELAQRHLREEQEAAAALWPLIAPLAARPAQATDQIQKADAVVLPETTASEAVLGSEEKGGNEVALPVPEERLPTEEVP